MASLNIIFPMLGMLKHNTLNGRCLLCIRKDTKNRENMTPLKNKGELKTLAKFFYFIIGIRGL